MPEWWEKRFLRNEFLLVVLLVTGFVAWCEAGSGLDHMGTWMAGNRVSIYATIASVAGVLLGFSITAVSILITIVDSPKFRLVRDSGHVAEIWDIFFQAIWAFGMATILAIVGLFFDRESDPNRVVLYANTGAFAFAVARGLREVWVLEWAVNILVPERKGTAKKEILS